MGDEEDRTARARRRSRDRLDPGVVILDAGGERDGSRGGEPGRPARLPMIGRSAAQIGRKEEVEFAGAHAADLTDAGVRRKRGPAALRTVSRACAPNSPPATAFSSRNRSRTPGRLRATKPTELSSACRYERRASSHEDCRA